MTAATSLRYPRPRIASDCREPEGRVREFLTANCGLVSPTAACHCSKRVDVAVRVGRINPQRLQFTDHTATVNSELVRFHQAADLLRCLPAASVPASTVDVVTNLIRNSTATA